VQQRERHLSTMIWTQRPSLLGVRRWEGRLMTTPSKGRRPSEFRHMLDIFGRLLPLGHAQRLCLNPLPANWLLLLDHQAARNRRPFQFPLICGRGCFGTSELEFVGCGVFAAEEQGVFLETKWDLAKLFKWPASCNACS